MEKLKRGMKRLAALISASLATDMTYAALERDIRIDDSNKQPIKASVLNPSVPFELAAHRSHRSHSSHSSHSSHRSSSGGYGTYSYPDTTESTTARTALTERSSNPTTTLRPQKTYSSKTLSKDALQNTIQRVQLSLTYVGYYQGGIDGIMGPATRAAITSYRKAKSLKTSEFIDAELLNSLGIKLSQ